MTIRRLLPTLLAVALLAACNRDPQPAPATGSPGAHTDDPGSLPRFMRYIGSYRKVRMLGTAALSLAYVACGRVDVYAERVMLWDAAAGAALVAGAGGIATVQPGAGVPYTCRVRAAS